MSNSIAEFLVSPSDSLLQVMTCIDRSAKGIALVVDNTQRLLGTVTDGDIRRALLKGATLASPVEPYMRRKFTAVETTAGRAEVLDLMRARSIEQVPIVDAAGKLVGLHVLREIIGTGDRPNWAVIMAGGKGTRLGHLTQNTPKPMLKVAGRPILERLVLHLVGYGITRIFISVNHLAHVIEEHFHDGERFGSKIAYLKETEALGTGGALSLLPEPPTSPVVVMNGDLVTDVDLARLLDFHAAGAYVATLSARRYLHEVPFGCLETNGPRLVRLEEKPVLERLVNAGVYVLSPELLVRVPRRYFPITELFESVLNDKLPVGVMPIEEDWIDVGQRDQLRQAREGV